MDEQFKEKQGGKKWKKYEDVYCIYLSFFFFFLLQRTWKNAIGWKDTTYPKYTNEFRWEKKV